MIPVLIPKQNDLKEPKQNKSGEDEDFEYRVDSEDSDEKYNENEITRFREVKQRNVVQSMKSEKIYLQLTTSSRRQDGEAYCEAAVDGIRMKSKGKLVLYAFAV